MPDKAVGMGFRHLTPTASPFEKEDPVSKKDNKVEVSLTAEECLLTVQALADSLTTTVHGFKDFSLDMFPQERARAIAEKAKRITQLSQSYADIIEPVDKRKPKKG